MLRQRLQQIHTDLRARFLRSFRTREIVQTLSVAHAEELRATPGELWGLKKEEHAQEIAQVRAGKYDIVDRRSWSYPYLPEALHRLNQPILKNVPYNLRRFSETPIPRRAINLIKNAVLALKWKIQPVKDADLNPEREKRIRIATAVLQRPNNYDSFRSLMEAVVDDFVIGGYGCIEPRVTPYTKRPLKMWAVDGSTIRIYADWTEGTPEKPRYAQMTGLKGERGIIAFRSDELIYIRDNIRASTPFGLGKLEVAFNTVNAFLGIQDMASKAGSDQVHKTWLWWKTTQNPAHIQTVRRHIQNEAEGQAKVSLMAGMQAPETIEINPVTPEDLLLDWQEFLIRIIANAFDLSPFALGLEKDVNRSTGEVMAQTDFNAAVVPSARKIEEAYTREIIQGKLKWKDLEFVYLGLEDPDMTTKAALQQRHYAMNAVTPDEIREEAGKPPLPGGWGRLTQGQMMILAEEAAARVDLTMQQALQKSMPSAPGMPPGGGGGRRGMRRRRSKGAGVSRIPSQQVRNLAPLPPASANVTRGPIAGGVFGAEEIAKMSPEEIEENQNMNLLPRTKQIKEQMEVQIPGILQTLTKELKVFLELQEDLETEDVQPAKVTRADQKKQLRQYEKGEQRDTVTEQILQDRGLWSPPSHPYKGIGHKKKSRKGERAKRRGKQPRSGGDSGTYV